MPASCSRSAPAGRNAQHLSNSAGLQKVLQETCLGLMRQPELWSMPTAKWPGAFVKPQSPPQPPLDDRAKGKLRSEVTSNVAGQRLQGFR